MGLRPTVLVVIATAGCTKPNPAFDQDGGGTRGDATEGEDTKDSSVTSVDTTEGRVDTTGLASSQGSGVTTMASDELGTTDGFESGTVECPQLDDYDWSVEIFQKGVPANVDCDVEFTAIGPVVMVADDTLGIADCVDCNCGTPRAQYEFHAQGLIPADHFIVGDCASITIEWSADFECRPIGFVVRSGDADMGRVHVVAGQDVETLPMTVGGAPIAVTPAETCECPECCPDTGTLALGFAGTSIVEGASADVDEFLGNVDSFFVRVHEAHALEDCTRSLSWSAILNL